jgi:hypothetical protein
MERPGFEPPLCAQSTNRSLYAIYSQIPVDNCALFHRRMTSLWIMTSFWILYFDSMLSLGAGYNGDFVGRGGQPGLPG